VKWRKRDTDEGEDGVERERERTKEIEREPKRGSGGIYAQNILINPKKARWIYARNERKLLYWCTTRILVFCMSKKNCCMSK
jgi:hypothetical protein